MARAYMSLLALRSELCWQRYEQRDCPVAEQDDQPKAKESGALVEEQSAKVDAPTRSAFFSSFFYALLRNAKNGYNYANVQRWSRKKQLEQMDRILFPINISNAHWCLAVVYPKEMKIKYFDSLGGKNSHCLKLLTRYMQDEGKARGIDAWTSEWATECVAPPQCPKQLDG